MLGCLWTERTHTHIYGFAWISDNIFQRDIIIWIYFSIVVRHLRCFANIWSEYAFIDDGCDEASRQRAHPVNLTNSKEKYEWNRELKPMALIEGCGRTQCDVKSKFQRAGPSERAGFMLAPVNGPCNHKNSKRNFRWNDVFTLMHPQSHLPECFQWKRWQSRISMRSNRLCWHSEDPSSRSTKRWVLLLRDIRNRGLAVATAHRWVVLRTSRFPYLPDEQCELASSATVNRSPWRRRTLGPRCTHRPSTMKCQWNERMRAE